MPTPDQTPPPKGAPPPPDPNKVALDAGNDPPEKWIPEKYHVRGAGKTDGPLDLELSARAMAKGYGELNGRMKDIGLPPEDPDKYELGGDEFPKDFDVAAFRKSDKNLGDFLKGAHALGLTNKQINYVVGKYIKVAPELSKAAAKATADDCVLDLQEAWGAVEGTDAYVHQMQRCHFAARKLAEAAGLSFDDVKGSYGNDSVFIRMMAHLATQMGEDVPPAQLPGGGAEGTADFEAKAAELRAKRDAFEEHDPRRKVAQAEIDALYNARFGTQRAGGLFRQANAA